MHDKFCFVVKLSFNIHIHFLFHFPGNVILQGFFKNLVHGLQKTIFTNHPP